MKNILDIVYDYSLNNKLLDQEAIKKIINICIDIDNIDSLREIHFKDNLILTNNFTIAAYNTKGYINIYKNAIKKEIDLNSQETYFQIEKELNEKEKFLRKNLHILYVLFHEVEHSKQIDKIRYYDTSLERKLLKAEYEFIYPTERNIAGKTNINYLQAVKNKGIVSKYYDISIMERLADVNAFINVKEISKNLSNNLYTLQDLILLDTELREYRNEFDSPTRRFLQVINKEEILDNIEPTDNLKYGLELSKDEYNKLIKKLK